MANNNLLPQDERPESTARLERSQGIAATGISFSNRNSPKEGGLIELPIVGSLDSFGIRYASASSNSVSAYIQRWS